MRKFLCSSLLALGLILASRQTAPAWVSWQVGAGFNWQWQSGNNRWLCGLFENGPAPGDPPLPPGRFARGANGYPGDFGYPGHDAFFTPPSVDYHYAPPHAPGNPAPPGFQAPPPAPVRSSLGMPVPAQPTSFPYYPGYYTVPGYYYPVSGYGW